MSIAYVYELLVLLSQYILLVTKTYDKAVAAVDRHIVETFLQQYAQCVRWLDIGKPELTVLVRGAVGAWRADIHTGVLYRRAGDIEQLSVEWCMALLGVELGRCKHE